jgi:two-component system chemotaxis response regulator CheY
VLSSYGDRWRVLEARRIGVNEYLRKPISVRQLSDRLISIVANPRPIVQRGAYYGPEPRDTFFVEGEPDVIASREQSTPG